MNTIEIIILLTLPLSVLLTYIIFYREKRKNIQEEKILEYYGVNPRSRPLIVEKDDCVVVYARKGRTIKIPRKELEKFL